MKEQAESVKLIIGKGWFAVFPKGGEIDRLFGTNEIPLPLTDTATEQDALKCAGLTNN